MTRESIGNVDKKCMWEATHIIHTMVWLKNQMGGRLYLKIINKILSVGRCVCYPYETSCEDSLQAASNQQGGFGDVEGGGDPSDGPIAPQGRHSAIIVRTIAKGCCENPGQTPCPPTEGCKGELPHVEYAYSYHINLTNDNFPLEESGHCDNIRNDVARGEVINMTPENRACLCPDQWACYNEYSDSANDTGSGGEKNVFTDIPNTLDMALDSPSIMAQIESDICAKIAGAGYTRDCDEIVINSTIMDNVNESIDRFQKSLVVSINRRGAEGDEARKDLALINSQTFPTTTKWDLELKTFTDEIRNRIKRRTKASK